MLFRLLEEGKAKSIGVGNFGVQHIEEMKEYAKVWPPHVNQIEVSQLLLDMRFHALYRVLTIHC